ncbi:MAG: GNAT family N-acetyltransferase, partial [Anaerolineales bacterium]|nr:GNAT family N-acetyltransferase [Anaerolineales bacterium]
ACQGQGAGSRLMEAVENRAREAGIGRLIVATSNDNPLALYFYQRLGFRITGVEIDSIRADGPDDSLIGMGGIPVRDEIQLEKRLFDGE